MRWFFLILLILNVGYFAWQFNLASNTTQYLQSRKISIPISTERLSLINKKHELQTSQSVCYTYGPINDKQTAQSLAQWFTQRDIHYQQRKTDEQNRTLLWIYLPAAPSTADSLARLAQLHQDGITDAHIIKKGTFANAISIGLFSSQDAVERRYQELKQKGYEADVIRYAGNKGQYWFDTEISNISRYQDELRNGLPKEFNPTVVDCRQIVR